MRIKIAPLYVKDLARCANRFVERNRLGGVAQLLANVSACKITSRLLRHAIGSGQFFGIVKCTLKGSGVLCLDICLRLKAS